jgi:hypothetical protein
MSDRKASHRDVIVNDKKQIQVEKEIELVRPGKGGTSDETQDEPSFPTGVDQGFVYYEG